jgi:tol-pal system protein YbgF
MKRLIILLLVLLVLPLFGGTKEDMEKLQSDLKSLENKFTGFNVELQDIKKRLEILEARLETVSRSSQTADMRMDLDDLARKVEMLMAEVNELKGSAGSYNPPPAGPAEIPKNTDPGKESPQSVYQSAYGEYLQGRYEMAVSEYQRFLSLYPDHPLAENSMYWIGESYYGLKKYEEAKSALLKTMEKYPKGAKFFSAKLKYALACYYAEDKATCRKLLQEITVSAPASQEAEIAKEKLKTLFPN